MHHSFFTFIKINREHKDPVYLQIVYQFINAIRQGILSDGTKLPGSRILAKELNIHRRTMVAALEELRTQDWLEVLPNIGTYIKNSEKKTSITISNPRNTLTEIPIISNYILDLPSHENHCKHHLNDGSPDYRIISSEELARFYSGVLKRKLHQNLNRNFQPTDFFYGQVTSYFNSIHHLSVQKKNLICASNREIILNIVVQMLIKQGDLVLVPELNYFFTNMIFRQAGAAVQTIPLTEDGIDVEAIRHRYQKGDIRLFYLSSRFQYPTGKSLSAENRKAILQLAHDYEFILIEDDTDAEFSYEKNQNNSLYKENSTSWVIYLGAVGRFLLPGFQTYCMIAPENIITEAQKYLNFFGNTDVYREQAIGEMISEGDMLRYRRKILKIYQERRKTFSDLLQNYFKEEITFQIPTGGLAFWIVFKSNISLVQLSEKCLQNGLYIPKYCLYQDRKTTAMRLGFAQVNEKELQETFEILAQCYFTLKNIGYDFGH
ncbi:MAG: PLP-dependent aminotransferase family protein [Bacteroidetes bacterium]|nr:PLP-dependent aminotransferase family protein [Bacteroidota bacterium]